MESELLIWTMVSIVGTVGVIKNLIGKGGRKLWTILTVLIGIGVAFVATKLPLKYLQVWVAVTGATLFYDTIFKSFQKLIEFLVDRIGVKEETVNTENSRE